MSMPSLGDFEVIGFDGTVSLECGRALPVARHRGDQYFVRLIATDEAVDVVHRYSRAEIELYASEGRVTLLPRPLSAKRDGVVVFVTESLLQTLGRPSPTHVLGEAADWVRIEVRPDFFAHATSLSGAAAAHVLNEWARLLADQALEHLAHFVRLEEPSVLSDAERAVDAGLAAAIDLTLRATLHERAGLVYLFADDVEGLVDSFELFVSREFDWLTWDGYRGRLSRLADLVKLKATAMPPVSPEAADDSEEAAATRLLALAPTIAECTRSFTLSEAEYRWLETLPLFGPCYSNAIQREGGKLELDPMVLMEGLCLVDLDEWEGDPFAAALFQPVTAYA